MAAFAQFGSDLDKATQEQLANGARLTEILKQPQYRPMGFEEQVVAIYSASPAEGRPSWVRGFGLEDIGRYEQEMLAYVKSQRPEILAEIQSTGKLEDAVKAKLDAALDAFAKVFQPSKPAAGVA
jgi:F-type H+-transporting ATPase subunit alpha